MSRIVPADRHEGNYEAVSIDDRRLALAARDLRERVLHVIGRVERTFERGCFRVRSSREKREQNSKRHRTHKPPPKWSGRYSKRRLRQWRHAPIALAQIGDGLGSLGRSTADCVAPALACGRGLLDHRRMVRLHALPLFRDGALASVLRLRKRL